MIDAAEIYMVDVEASAAWLPYSLLLSQTVTVIDYSQSYWLLSKLIDYSQSLLLHTVWRKSLFHCIVSFTNEMDLWEQEGWHHSWQRELHASASDIPEGRGRLLISFCLMLKIKVTVAGLASRRCKKNCRQCLCDDTITSSQSQTFLRKQRFNIQLQQANTPDWRKEKETKTPNNNSQ